VSAVSGAPRWRTRWAVGNAANDYSVLLPEDASVAPVRFASDGACVSLGLRGADGGAAGAGQRGCVR